MKKTKGKVFAAVVLSILLMVSLVIAAPPAAQVPSTHPPQVGGKPPVEMRITDSRPESFALHIGDRYIHVGETGVIFSGNTVNLSASVLLCGCVNRPVWVKFDVDGQTINEYQVTPASNYNPSEPPCAATTTCNNQPAGQGFPGWGKSFGASWTAVKGTHTLRVTTDSKSAIAETNEQNNSMSITITVAAPLLQPMPLKK